MSHRRGYSIPELLIVTLILIALILLVIPAVASLLRTSRQSLAEQQVSSVVAAARAAAIASPNAGDTAAVFFYDTSSRRTRVTVCRVAGRMFDLSSSAGGGFGIGQGVVERDVFVPVADVPGVTLPQDWSARGYVPPYWLDLDWYGDSDQRDTNVRMLVDEAHWAFPETSFYDDEVVDDGAKRQTFMIRFRAGTGQLMLTPAAPSLVVDARPTTLDRNGSPFDDYRVDLADDLEAFVRRVLNDPDLDNDDRRELLGDESGDTILARPIEMIALYDETRLAAALGVRPSPTTGTLYEVDENDPEPKLLDGPDVELDNISRWLVGDTDLDGDVEPVDDTGEGDQPVALVLVVDAATGGLIEAEVQP